MNEYNLATQDHLRPVSSLERAEDWNFDVSRRRRLQRSENKHRIDHQTQTYRLARSLSSSLRSTSSAVSTSNRVRNSSASAQSRHTLRSGFGPRPSFGARPHPSPSPVLSFIRLFPLLSRGRSAAASSATSRDSPPMTPHSIASRLCLTISS